MALLTYENREATRGMHTRILKTPGKEVERGWSMNPLKKIKDWIARERLDGIHLGADLTLKAGKKTQKSFKKNSGKLLKA